MYQRHAYEDSKGLFKIDHYYDHPSISYNKIPYVYIFCRAKEKESELHSTVLIRFYVRFLMPSFLKTGIKPDDIETDQDSIQIEIFNRLLRNKSILI
jgi:hypothetical protein